MNYVKCLNGTSCPSGLDEIVSNYPLLELRALGRSAMEQAGYQAIALGLTIAMAFMGGVISGIIGKKYAMKCGNYFPRQVWRTNPFHSRSDRRQNSDDDIEI